MSLKNTIEIDDDVIIEEPLEIRVHGQPISVTMRTPGNDQELALGFLLSEGIIKQVADVHSMQQEANRIDVTLHIKIELKHFSRHIYTNSSCGTCSKNSLDALQIKDCPLLTQPTPSLSAELICSLPKRMRQAQSAFKRTGGVHAAALFGGDAQLKCLREDVGRHNALDKVLGSQLLKGGLYNADWILLLSGRVSFEMMQKALMGGIAVVVAIGAPSTLAISVAQRFGMTLLGFTKDDCFNVYTGFEKINEGQANDEKKLTLR